MLLSANSGLHGARPGQARYSVLESADFLADVGFDAIDVNFGASIYPEPEAHDNLIDGDDWKKNLDALLDKCRQRDLKIRMTHLPFRFKYRDESHPDFPFNYTMTCRALEASEYIGAEWAVMHVTEVEDTVKYVRKLFADSKISRLGIAIENIFKFPMENVIEACDILTAEGYKVGACLDLGHAHINGWYEYDVADAIRMVGKRIKVIHVHDNFRSDDHHIEPYRGTIDWPGVMKALKEVGFEGDLNYEMIISRLPESVRHSYARFCVDLGRHLIDLYDQHQP